MKEELEDKDVCIAFEMLMAMAKKKKKSQAVGDSHPAC